ncbi:hypothetical protein NHP21005_16840 [Helicobacter sp. NHP21005]|uniref:hypothetical protein n=1 Tax=Helicobacter felistomachi TaxID=3040201 RepID=UPI002572DD48|nr:hypothetical protein [Helicobacter sp. NHP21005]BEG57996.1 hypothetical protein NHP21005_16840 [Helicobacter sp. NHP21005]
MDCAGANPKLNNDYTDQELAKPNVGEKHLVYVFSAVQYSQNPEFAKKVQTDLEVYNDFAKDKWSIHEIFALGTHSP